MKDPTPPRAVRLEAVNAELDGILGRIVAQGASGPGATGHVRVGSGVLREVTPYLRGLGAPGPVWLVCDPNTWRAAASRLAAELGGAGFEVVTRVMDPEDPDEDLVCDASAVDELRRALAEREATGPRAHVVAVGAGTVGDIVKMATAELGRPYVCVATAASMNGYTSSIAAVLVDGVKRTLPAQSAQAVFADVDVLRTAPPQMHRAGFGDLLSKPFSHADWLLAHRVRGVPYDEAPARLLDRAYEAMLAAAPEIGRAEPQAIGLLARALLISGFSMAMAGTSAPASGGEHLVSHYWDMERHCQGLPLRALHGAQVGVATVLSARMFEALLSAPVAAVDPVARAAQRPDPSAVAVTRADHPHLTAAVRGEVQEQWLGKQRCGAALVREIEAVQAGWGETRRLLDAALVPAARVEQALAQAGCPATPADLGVSREDAARTLRVCRQIRGRYVALDLMDDLGLLPAAVDAALA